jgi:cytochrome c oxidase subunit 2
MQTKWTALSLLTILLFISLIPLVVSQGSDAGFWMWMPESITPAGQQIGWIFNMTLVITGILFVDIHAIMIFYVIRYRERDLEEAGTGNYFFLESLFAVVPTVILLLCGYYLFYPGSECCFWLYGALFFVGHTLVMYYLLHEDDFSGEETSDVHGHLGVEITWTIIPTIIMIVLGIYSFEVYSKITTPVEDPVHVQVTGLQFAWQVDYPDRDVSLNNRLVLPSDRAIQLHMSSNDVLHSFYVPSLRMKQDLVPGQETHMFIESINRSGTYDIRCAELCGVGHYRMDGTLYVLSPDDYDEFLSFESRGDRIQFLEKVSGNE